MQFSELGGAIDPQLDVVFDLNVPIKILDTLLTDPLHIGLQIDDPKNLFAAENFDVDFPDLSEFFNDLSFNIFSIVDGLAILIDKLADGLKSKFIANLPIIGDNLESFGERLDRFLENFVQPLQEKLDTIKDFIDENLSEAGLEGHLRQFFFDLLGPGSFIGGQEGLLRRFDPNTGDFVAIQTVDELTTEFIDVVFDDPNDPSENSMPSPIPMPASTSASTSAAATPSPCLSTSASAAAWPASTSTAAST